MTDSAYEKAVQQYKEDITNLLSDYDGLASGLNIGNTVSSDGNVKHAVSTYVTTQGEACRAAFEFATPRGFTELFSFNLLVDGQASYDEKSGLMVIRIPQNMLKPGRVFALIAVDKDGMPHYFTDLDADPDTLSAQIDFVGYAFDVIYMD